ncbi:hypothetical protein FVE85_7124 [Porphyridium purpureum]|uniref:DUF1415 domain-containing protein n=1 Tax=Porphyridium purpureum TaxID=35688 RepID=A0A5J4Z662_PORPP|nr:hypothetical protein FVE85_7124 [Porphyridium purpureum]|eukprot:POR5043..scf295_1
MMSNLAFTYTGTRWRDAVPWPAQNLSQVSYGKPKCVSGDRTCRARRAVASCCVSSGELPDLKVQQRVMKWVRDIVIGLGLCPFAERELREGKMLVRVLESVTSFDKLSEIIEREMGKFVAPDMQHVSTYLLVVPPGSFLDAQPFEVFAEFAAEFEERIERDPVMSELVMPVFFHPNHQWYGLDPTDPVNFDRRAPYPICNFLRTPQVDRLAALGLTQTILEDNQTILGNTGFEQLRALHQSIYLSE